MYIATGPQQKGINLSGWETVEGWTFHYTAGGTTPMAVYRRATKAGETVYIPQGNWTGGIVLAPKLTVGEMREPVYEKPPGVIIDTSPDFQKVYIGSPSIAILPNRDYVASHDLFGPGTPTRESVVLASNNKGQTWKKLTQLDGHGDARRHALEHPALQRRPGRPRGDRDGLRRWQDGRVRSRDRLYRLSRGGSKFTIRFEPVSKRYWSLVNKQTDPEPFRNILVLTSPADLRHWRVEETVLEHPDQGNYAFQYVDWLFEGDDIIAVSRTAWEGSHNAHDANYMTFHRIEDFRQGR